MASKRNECIMKYYIFPALANKRDRVAINIEHVMTVSKTKMSTSKFKWQLIHDLNFAGYETVVFKTFLAVYLK